MREARFEERRLLLSIFANGLISKEPVTGLSKLVYYDHIVKK